MGAADKVPGWARGFLSRCSASCPGALVWALSPATPHVAPTCTAYPGPSAFPPAPPTHRSGAVAATSSTAATLQCQSLAQQCPLRMRYYCCSGITTGSYLLAIHVVYRPVANGGPTIPHHGHRLPVHAPL